ncbi:hypothetical protein C6P45_004898 [Maudiozyma exigua]|uniref:VASt domain-containing protein n=1 Tax=Maudiozyma exigua TaxID=34358 RepID=A0A9P7B9L3_MAUEX|nr:hypothetical protein C6P45_004898 [Kazachstania exigua]
MWRQNSNGLNHNEVRAVLLNEGTHNNHHEDDERGSIGGSRAASLHSHPVQWGHHKRGSDSSTDITLPKYMKSSPADPKVSDVNSVSMIANDSIVGDSRNDLVAAVTAVSSVTGPESKGVTQTPSSFFDNIISSFPFNKGKEELVSGSRNRTRDLVYASSNDDTEFHNLFKLIPSDEKLVESLDCNLNRNYPYHGKLYITKGHICFNSALLDWLAQIQIPIKDIISIKKNVNSALYEDEICVETTLGMTRFNGFKDIEATYELLSKIVKQETVSPLDTTMSKRGTDLLNYSVGLNPPVTQKSSIVAGAETNPVGKSSIKLLTSLEATANNVDASSNKIATNEENIENLIRSIDEISSLNSDSSESLENSETNVRIPVYKLKENGPHSKEFNYSGPLYNMSKKTRKIPTRSVNEYTLADIELSCAPGMVFDFLFNENEPTFLTKFLSKQDSSNFTTIGKFEINNSGQKTREYSYQKQLHFPVGPSTTQCNVEEMILHNDVNDYVELINTTRTPNVPSGTNFSTKTRYIIQWHDTTRCKLKLSFWVEWTGSSWIKNMVESSCKSGLVSSTVDFINLIEEFIEQHTTVDYITVDKSSKSDSTTKETSPSTIGTKENSLSVEPTEGSEGSGYLTTGGTMNNSSLTTILLFMNVILFALLIYSVWCLNLKLNHLIQFQQYNSDGVSYSPEGLYETPVRSDILNTHDPHYAFLQSLRSLLGIRSESSTNNVNDLPEKILEKLMRLLDRDKTKN